MQKQDETEPSLIILFAEGTVIAMKKEKLSMNGSGEQHKEIIITDKVEVEKYQIHFRKPI